MSTPTIYIYHSNHTSTKVTVCSMDEDEAKGIAESILGECFLACSINPMQLGYKIYDDPSN